MGRPELRQKLTQRRLKDALHYNPETGVWAWLISTARRIEIGDIAGHINAKDGYRRIKIDGSLYLSNRLSFFYMEGYFPENDVDHINRIRHDDKWLNLREVSRQVNIRNCGIRKTNKSGVKGVLWVKERLKWAVSITVNYKKYSLGRYKDFEEAVFVRFAAEQCLGWDSCDAMSLTRLYLISNNLIKE